MTDIKQFIIVIASLLISTCLFAQEEISLEEMKRELAEETQEVEGPYSDVKTPHLKKYFKSAKRARDHYSQIDFLEELTNRKPEELKYKYYLARAYDNSRNFQRALEEYSKAYYGDQEEYAVCLFHMGRIMKTREQYDLAKVYFEKFIKNYNDKNDGKYYKKLVKAEILGCEFGLAEDTSNMFTSEEHVEGYVNFANIEFSPFILDSNTFWYVSLPSDSVVFIKDDVIDETTLLKRKIYEAKKINGRWKNNGEAEIFINDNKHNVGSFSFSEDRQRVYYTICKPNWQNRILCNLYMSKKDEEGNWGKPLLIPSEVNSKKYTSTHPSVGVSAKEDREIIYYASDRPGGKGHMDIWYTRYRISKDKFDKARNCGTKVNTVGNELAPSYDNKAHELYFSSDGWTSIGGLDVQKVAGERTKYTSKAKNAGKSVNSPVDDMYYSLFEDRETALIVSNRTGSISLKHEHCCDDIFLLKWFNVIHIKLGGEVTDSSYSTLDSAMITILLVDSAIGGERIVAERLYTEKDGGFSTELFPGNKYRIIVSKDGFFNESIELNTEKINKDTEIEKRFTLRPIPGEEIVIPNVYYDFDDASLNQKAKTAIDTSIYVLLLDNPTLIVEIASHTDNKGSHAYNQNLSQNRAQSVVNYLRKKGIDKERLKAVGYGETKPVAQNMFTDGTDNPEGRARNRRTSFKVIGQLDADLFYEDE